MCVAINGKPSGWIKVVVCQMLLFSRAIVPTESIHILSFRSQLKCFNFNAVVSVGNGRHWHMNKLFVVVAAVTAMCNSHRVRCLLSALPHNISPLQQISSDI